MCGKAVPERVTTRGLRNSRALDRQFHGVSEDFSHRYDDGGSRVSE